MDPIGARRELIPFTSSSLVVPRVSASLPQASVDVTPGMTTLQLTLRPAHRSAKRRIAYSMTHLPEPGISYPAFALYCRVHPGEEMPTKEPPFVMRARPRSQR